MIVFNVDFTVYGDDPQAGFAIIRPGGACPACDSLHAVTGGLARVGGWRERVFSRENPAALVLCVS